ncbi:MAG TPA: glycosyltransferase family 2 protein [Acidimicrobiales bacterium]|nr:glycosyltransferase family 2 protein [Acidimicrobiales bacterium]
MRGTKPRSARSLSYPPNSTSRHREPSVRSLSRPGNPAVSLVIPALNEAKNLPWVLERVPDGIAEVILVDGSSSDGTAEVALSLRSDIIVVSQFAPGKGAALAAGLMAASGDIVVMIDADCSMDPQEIPLFVDALVSGADMVKGSRYVPGAGSEDLTRLRSLGNRCLSIAANVLHGTRWSELCYGFAAMWTDVLDPLDILNVAVPPEADATDGELSAGGPHKRPRRYGQGFEIEALLFCRAARAGLEVVEVPSWERERMHGASKLLTFRDGLRVLGAVLKERRLPAASAPTLFGGY